MDPVAEAIMEAEEAEIRPRFRQLATGDVVTKSPGEIVTAADKACEDRLTSALEKIRDIPVVGEEAATARPAMLDLIDVEPAVWLLDPLDGTSNFAAGSVDYAVMVALVEAGVTTAAWLWHPATGEMATARRGEGAAVNGSPVVALAPTGGADDFTGVLKTRFLPADLRARAESAFGPGLKGRGCAGVEYPDLVAGRTDFIIYWRTLPWDHAPGVLFAEEAGCRASRFDGSPYRPGDDGAGLLVAHRDIQPELVARLRHD